MAESTFTLAGLLKINDLNLKDVEITDLLNDAPLLAAMYADVASNGTLHKYTVEDGTPVVGFRVPNQGLPNSTGSDRSVTVELKILDASYAVDKAIADAYVKGREKFLDRETKRHLRAALFAAEQQIINGSAAAGFDGMADVLDDLDHPMVVAGGGSTALSSVYLIRSHSDGTDVSVIAGQDGQIEVGETIVQRMTITEDSSGGGDPGTHLPCYYTPIQGWLGLQVGSKYSMGRIANLDAGSNKLTDAKLYDAISRFPSGRQPNIIVMGRRSVFQLQASRTATNPTGAPVPIPTEINGIPIISTDAIGVAESVVTSQ